MSQMTYDQLFADDLADVEAGKQHPCGTTDHCTEMGGCPCCFQAVMRGDIGIEQVDVFADSGILRITTTGHDGKPCVVSFRKVPFAIHRTDAKRMRGER